MEAPSWELWRIDSKLSPRVKCVLQMGVTVFEEADLVFCCSTSQKMKRKNISAGTAGYWSGFCLISRPCVTHTLVSPQVSSFPLSAEVEDQGCIRSVISCLLLKYSQQMEMWDRSQGLSPSRSDPGTPETAFTAPTA